MPQAVRTGVSVTLARDQRPLGVSVMEITREPSGERVDVELPAPTVYDLVQFAELDDGRRLTTEGLGDLRLEIPLAGGEEELRAEVREFVFEDDLRDMPCVAAEPRWELLIEALERAGVSAGEQALDGLPFDVELDPEVTVRLGG